jgi:hypothetical protein
LKRALAYEREVSAREHRRAELLEAAAHEAYRNAFRIRLTRTEAAKDTE